MNDIEDWAVKPAVLKIKIIQKSEQQKQCIFDYGKNIKKI